MAPAEAPGPRDGDCPPPPRPGAPSLESSRRSSTSTPLPAGGATTAPEAVSPQTKAAESFRFSAAKPAAVIGGHPTGPRRPDSLGTTSRRYPFAGGSRPNETFAHTTLARLGGQKPISAPARLTRRDTAGTDDENADTLDHVLLLPEPTGSSQTRHGAPAESDQSASILKQTSERATSLDLPKPPSEVITSGDPNDSGYGNISRGLDDPERQKMASHTRTSGPNAPAQLPTDSKAKPPPRRASAEGIHGLDGSRKWSIDESEAPAERPKRNKGVPGEAHHGEGDPAQPSSRSETPATDATHTSAQEKDERRRKTSTTRSYVAERTKKQGGTDGHRSEPRSRPPVSAQTVEETISSLRRWQRHEKDAEDEIRRLRVQLEAKDRELAETLAKKDKLKNELVDRVYKAAASARQAESEYKAKTAEVLTALTLYKRQLSEGLAELRAEVSQTKTVLEPCADNLNNELDRLEETKVKVLGELRSENQKWRDAVENLKKELDIAVGKLAEAQERLEQETARAAEYQQRGDAYAKQVDELRIRNTDEVTRLSSSIHKLQADEIALRIAHEELLQAKSTAHHQQLAELRECLGEARQEAGQNQADLEAKAATLRGEMAKLVQESAAAAHAHAQEVAELTAEVQTKELEHETSRTSLLNAEEQLKLLKDEIASLQTRYEESQEALRDEAERHQESLEECRRRHAKEVQTLSADLAQFAAQSEELANSKRDLATLEDEHESLKRDRDAAVRAAEEARRYSAQLEEAVTQSRETVKTKDSALSELRKRFQQAQEDLEAAASGKESLEKQLATAQSLVATLNATPKKDAAADQKLQKLQQQVDELTTALADAMAQGHRATSARTELSLELEQAREAMLKMQTERAAYAKRIEDLEEQRSDLERRHASANSSSRQVELDKALQAQAAAFEAEKQEAVRRTMDACAERGKLEMLNAQNEMKRLRNALTEKDEKLRKAQTELVKAKDRSRDVVGASRPLLHMGTPVSVSPQAAATEGSRTFGRETDTPSKTSYAVDAGSEELSPLRRSGETAAEAPNEEQMQPEPKKRKTVRFDQPATEDTETEKAGPAKQRKRIPSTTRLPFSRKTAPRTYGTRKSSRWGREMIAESDESGGESDKAMGESDDGIEQGTQRESMLSRLEEQGERAAANDALEDVDDPIQDSLPTQAVPPGAARAVPPATVNPVLAKLPPRPKGPATRKRSR